MRLPPKVAIAFFFLFLTVVAAHAQEQDRSPDAITGYVFDAETDESLPGVNVFLDGTLRGAATNAEGYFRIDGVPPGRYTLVASMVGYEQQQTKITMPEAGQRGFRFQLSPRTTALEGVTVTDDRSLWLDRLERFKMFFIGTTPNAEACEFVNPAVLGFEVDEKTGALHAYASRPLRMVNRALGYEITFHINDFAARGTRSYHQVHQSVTARFRTLESESAEQRRRWQEARRKAYYGSFFHFAHTLAAGTTREAGYRMHKTTSEKLLTNPDAVPPWERSFKVAQVEAPAIVRPARRDTWIVLQLDDEYDYLHVAYLREPSARKYVQTYRPMTGWINRQASRLDFTRLRRAVVNLQTGQFIRPFSPMMQGYWGWSQRAAEMLPRGYLPESGT